MAEKKAVETEATEKVEKEIAVEEESAPVEEPAKIETPEKSDDKKKKIIIAVVAILLIILAFLLWFFNRKFDVKFDPNNGEDKYIVQVKYNKLIDEKDVKDEEELGEDFIDWYLVIVDEDGKEKLDEDPFDFEHEKIKKDIELRAVYKGEPAPVEEEPTTEAPVVTPETTAAPETTTKAPETTTTTKAAEKAPTIKLSVDNSCICGYAGSGVATVKATLTNAKDSDVTWEANGSGSNHTWDSSKHTLTAKTGQFDQYTVTVTATVKTSGGTAKDSVTITIEPQLVLFVNILETYKNNETITSNVTYSSLLQATSSHQVVVQAKNKITVSAWNKNGLTVYNSLDNGYTFQGSSSSASLTVTSQCGQSITIDFTSIN